uniref:Uncharacterized protein n=1 Tax=Faxonius propinquus nudivirus TaxID=3139431 RepID=A0AAU8GCB9_9VIRU
MSSSTINRFLKPECIDMSKAMAISGTIEIIIIVIIFIMLVFVASYNNMTPPATDEEIAAKAKYINGLVIASAVISLILVGVGIWHLMSSSKVKKCIDPISKS